MCEGSKGKTGPSQPPGCGKAGAPAGQLLALSSCASFPALYALPPIFSSLTAVPSAPFLVILAQAVTGSTVVLVTIEGYLKTCN